MPNESDAIGLAELSDMTIFTPPGAELAMTVLADLMRRIRLGFPDADSIDVTRNKPNQPIWVEIRGPGSRLIQRQIHVRERQP